MGRHEQFGTLREAARTLREHLPPPHPVRVLRKRLPNNAGWCIERKRTKNRKKHYEIQIDKSLAESAAVLILLHEWAHTLSFDAEGDNHGREWHRAYGRVWRLYEKIVLNPEDEKE